jgi:hypothetical protein
MLSDFINVGILLLMVLVHEIGHVLDARRFKIYDGWFFRGMAVGIKFKKILPSRWYYLSGVLMSFLVYPLTLLLSSFGLADYRWPWLFPLMAILLGSMDILVFFYYDQAKRFHDNTKFIVFKDTILSRLYVSAFALEGEPIIWIRRRRY